MELLIEINVCGIWNIDGRDQLYILICRLLDMFDFESSKYAGEFDDLLDGSAPNVLSNISEEIHLMYSHVDSSPLLESNGSMTLDKRGKLLEIENLTLGAPNGSTLVRDLELIVQEKEHLLVCETISFIY